jgi:hypothetical protein
MAILAFPDMRHVQTSIFFASFSRDGSPMRQGQQNRRGRGRNRKGQNPLSRNFESNGPDVKIRGNAAHIAEKYMSLARDALSSGDAVMAENYLQHAEHYNRIIMAAQQNGDQMNGGMGHRQRAQFGDFDADDDSESYGDEQPPMGAAGGMGQGMGGQGMGQPRDPFAQGGRPQRDERGFQPHRDREGGQHHQQRFHRQPDYARQPQPGLEDQPEISRQPAPAFEAEPAMLAEAGVPAGEPPHRPQRHQQGNRGDFRRDRGGHDRNRGEDGGFRQRRQRRPSNGAHAHGGGEGSPRHEEGQPAPTPAPRAKDDAEGNPPVA